jgi:hypothetical protein
MHNSSAGLKLLTVQILNDYLQLKLFTIVIWLQWPPNSQQVFLYYKIWFFLVRGRVTSYATEVMELV